MAMSNRSNRKNDCFILCTIEDIVPQDHEVRRLERAVNWEFIYPEVKHLTRKSSIFTAISEDQVLIL